MKPRSAKVVGILLHPLTLAALALYALNSCVLQPLAPSWLTGKLGDLAWVFFFPYILTVILARLLPEEPAFALSVAITGIGFALVKTTAANAWLVGLLQGTFRQPVFIVRDPTDLLALFALAGTVRLWRQYRPATAMGHKGDLLSRRHDAGGMTHGRREAALLILPLVMFLMLADAAMPNYGVTYLEAQGNAILACSTYGNYGSYRSSDGGMSWTGVSYDAALGQCANQPEGNGSIVDPADGRVFYRYAAYTIQRSTDGGQTWKMDYSWRPLGQAGQLYYQTVHQDYGPYTGSPTFAVGDPATGNIIFAMGTQGVLVRKAGSGAYAWVEVGSYRKIEIGAGKLVAGLLAGEWILALIAGGLGIVQLGLVVRKGKAKAVFTWLGIAGWLAVVWIFPPALYFTSQYSAVFPAAGLLLAGGLALILAVITFFQAGAAGRGLLWKFGLACLGLVILFILPYILWALNVLPQYQIASAAATALTVAAAIGLRVWLPKWLPPQADEAGRQDQG